MNVTTPHPRIVAVEMPNSGHQLLAAQQIIDALPGHNLTIGEGLAILTVALDSLGVIDHPEGHR
jgi:hypothetical protein